MEKAGKVVSDFRMAWAQQIMSERMNDYRESVHKVAIAIEMLRKAEGERQALLKLFGAAGHNSGLACAPVNVAKALIHAKPFTEAAVRAGIITRDELNV